MATTTTPTLEPIFEELAYRDCHHDFHDLLKADHIIRIIQPTLPCSLSSPPNCMYISTNTGIFSKLHGKDQEYLFLESITNNTPHQSDNSFNFYTPYHYESVSLKQFSNIKELYSYLTYSYTNTYPLFFVDNPGCFFSQYLQKILGTTTSGVTDTYQAFVIYTPENTFDGADKSDFHNGQKFKDYPNGLKLFSLVTHMYFQPIPGNNNNSHKVYEWNPTPTTPTPDNIQVNNFYANGTYTITQNTFYISYKIRGKKQDVPYITTALENSGKSKGFVIKNRNQLVIVYPTDLAPDNITITSDNKNSSKKKLHNEYTKSANNPYYLTAKRAGDQLQALAIKNFNVHQYFPWIANSSKNFQFSTSDNENINVIKWFVTHDRLAVSFALLQGFNVILATDSIQRIYRRIENISTIPSLPEDISQQITIYQGPTIADRTRGGEKNGLILGGAKIFTNDNTVEERRRQQFKKGINQVDARRTRVETGIEIKTIKRHDTVEQRRQTPNFLDEKYIEYFTDETFQYEAILKIIFFKKSYQENEDIIPFTQEEIDIFNLYYKNLSVLGFFNPYLLTYNCIFRGFENFYHNSFINDLNTQLSKPQIINFQEFLDTIKSIINYYIVKIFNFQPFRYIEINDDIEELSDNIYIRKINDFPITYEIFHYLAGYESKESGVPSSVPMEPGGESIKDDLKNYGSQPMDEEKKNSVGGKSSKKYKTKKYKKNKYKKNTNKKNTNNKKFTKKIKKKL
jgi:hypothetical protein